MIFVPLAEFGEIQSDDTRECLMGCFRRDPRPTAASRHDAIAGDGSTFDIDDGDRVLPPSTGSSSSVPLTPDPLTSLELYRH
jgi:hypothetical protein